MIGPQLRERLDLEAISRVVEAELFARIRELGPDFAVCNIEPLQRTPNKGYTARGQAEVTYQGNPLGSGKVTTVLFMPGEGTGDQNTMQLNTVIPTWTPRKKEGHAEIIMALGTGYQGGKKWISGLISLDQMISDGGTSVLRAYNRSFNIDRGNLRNACDDSNGDVGAAFSRISRFGSTYEKGDRIIGGPHAIVFPDGPISNFFKPEESVFQVASFLPFPERTDGYDATRGSMNRLEYGA